MGETMTKSKVLSGMQSLLTKLKQIHKPTLTAMEQKILIAYLQWASDKESSVSIAIKLNLISFDLPEVLTEDREWLVAYLENHLQQVEHASKSKAA